MFFISFLFIFGGFFYIIHKACIIWFCLRAFKKHFFFSERVGALWSRPHIFVLFLLEAKRGVLIVFIIVEEFNFVFFFSLSREWILVERQAVKSYWDGGIRYLFFILFLVDFCDWCFFSLRERNKR